MAIRAIRLGEGGESEAVAYKALRLEGLERDPTAFAHSYEQIEASPIEGIRAELKANIVVGVLMDGDDIANAGISTVNGKLIGIGGVRRNEAANMNHIGMVYGNYVTQDIRRKGVGRLIMQELEEQARAAVPTALLPAFQELQLRVVDDNKAAIRLYQSMGFTQFGFSERAVRYQDKYIGEYYMHKYLIDVGNQE